MSKTIIPEGEDQRRTWDDVLFEIALPFMLFLIVFLIGDMYGTHREHKSWIRAMDRFEATLERCGR